jgi:LytS/YehU family sensor histidine kinase
MTDWSSFQLMLAQVTQPLASQSIIDQQNEQIQRMVLLALVPVVVAFSFIVFIFYRAKREAFFRQKETELKLRIAEGDLKTLRAQINPHFIFNCLNSIHHYMQGHESAKAGEYLLKFSQLIRHVLESSTVQTVPLTEELEANRWYMQLEQLRMNTSFSFTIDCDPKLNIEKLEVPPMLIQPFVENAIWHGLKPGGSIRISIRPYKVDHLQCVIEDEGVSLMDQPSTEQHQVAHTVKKTSLGMTLMKDRFETLNHLHGSQAGYMFFEKPEGGRQVTLTIPFES